MYDRFRFLCAVFGLTLSLGYPAFCEAQAYVLSATPPNVEYQYQLYYPRVWGWPGPGLSLGGSLPANGREGISSFYGRPFPVPLGAGVYVNPFTYATQLPAPTLSFGLAASATSTSAPESQVAQPIRQVVGLRSQLAPSGTSVAAFPAADISTQPSRRPVPVSSNSSLEKGRAIELFGDEKLKTQQWMQAYVNYRNAVLIADDLADAHVRLGFTCLALKRYSEATQEFKRALFIDPTAGNSGETLASIFGPDSDALRAELIRTVALWAKEDLRDQDRLFLLGVVLHFDADKRADQILEAAYRLTGSGDHLLAMMSPVPRPDQTPVGNSLSPIPVPPETLELPKLHQQPLALH